MKSPCILVLDTCYLMELYEVPHNHDPDFVRRVKARFKEAIIADARFYVPFPVLFEWANHIAHLNDGGSRHTHADALYQKVAAVVGISAGAPPWKIWGADASAVARFAESLKALTAEYAEQYAIQQIGLTDTALIQAARTLKQAQLSAFSMKVHIWTKDIRLKAHEPDKELEPLMG